mgnify:CR=1 FL=1
MNHYTNVQSWGNKIFLRKWENNQRINEEIKDFHPPIWIPAKSKDAPTGWKNLDG